RRLDKGLRVKRLESLDDFLARDFEQRFSLVAFDNVCSAVRRSAWEGTPFSRVEFGEDLDWSFRVLQHGGHILHNPEAHICHSHNWAPLRRLRRYFTGSRSSLHILHLPPEHSILRDRDAARGLDEFTAWVHQLTSQQDSHGLLLPRLLHTLLPERRRSALRATAHLLARRLLRRHVALRLRLSFANLWSQVSQLNGSSALRAPHVVENLGAILVGGFLGSYYHTCQVENRVTPALDALVRRVGADG
ncbi:MAG: glycosyltransferase family 2 protein, partial [Terriglobia bacterium]